MDDKDGGIFSWLKKQRPVANWKSWWKWHSTYITGVFFAFPIAWTSSPQLQHWMPPALVSALAPVAAIILFLGRIRDQTKR